MNFGLFLHDRAMMLRTSARWSDASEDFAKFNMFKGASGSFFYQNQSLSFLKRHILLKFLATWDMEKNTVETNLISCQELGAKFLVQLLKCFTYF